MKKLLFLCLLHLILLPHTGLTSEINIEVEKHIEEPIEQAISIMQKSQKDDEDWRSLQAKLTTELELLQSHMEELISFRNQQKQQITHAQKRVTEKQQQLADIQQIEQEMDPFLVQLVNRLAKIPEQDLPFLQDERKARINKLVDVLQAPDISISEKYRKSMEALLIEAEFGVTIETYQEMLERDNQKILVNILRLGRLGLYYVTLDESGCGFFNIADKRWQLLPNKYIHSLQTAVAIANKRRPAELLDMPLGRVVPK